MHPLLPFFKPQGVAIIGASSNPTKLSFGIFKNLLQYGFQGKIYPVNPNAKEILGLTCYPDILSVPDPVDLAVSVVASNLTPAVLEACGQRGIKAVTIISGGFREIGPEGEKLEKQCLEIAHKYGMHLVGPNCVGTMDLYSGLNTTFIHGVPEKGHIGFLSQSGAICGGIVDYVRGKHIGFSNFVSLGNEADVTETDMIEYLADDPDTRVIALYVEAIKDGSRFMGVCEQVAKTKPIVLLKAGKTQAGAKAVSSHTGSIAGAITAYKTAFKQCGVIEVDTVADLFDVAHVLTCQALPRGNRAVILTNSGGPAALASDSLGMHGFSLANLEKKTQEVLRSHLNPSAQVSNPVDMLGGAEPEDYERSFKELAEDPNVDILLPILVPQALIKAEKVAEAIVNAAKGLDKPVLCCFMGDEAVQEARRVLHKNGFPMFTFPDSLGRVLASMKFYADWIEKSHRKKEWEIRRHRGMVEEVLSQYKYQRLIGEKDTRPILEAYGIPVIAGGFAANLNEAQKLYQEFGPSVVMKIVSPHILHKSDVGGIRIGIRNSEELEASYHQMMEEVKQKMPEAMIEGVLIERMAPKGQEVIIGMKRDPVFGPLLMFGFGGIFVEVFQDVAFRIAPVEYQEAREMVFETKSGRLLTGYRNLPEFDVEGIVEGIQRLGQLALDFPQIAEVEINPCLVLPKGQGILALDGRIVLAEEQS